MSSEKRPALLVWCPRLGAMIGFVANFHSRRMWSMLSPGYDPRGGEGDNDQLQGG
jgi:hypothetical protein